MPKAFAKKIEWLGHDAFREKSKKTVYFDPYQIADGPRRLILSSFLMTILITALRKMYHGFKDQKQ